MLKVLVLIAVLTSLFSSCSAQSLEPRADWKTVESPDAGFKATFPCEPASTKKLFQKEPKIANLYSYKCDHQGISFRFRCRKDLKISIRVGSSRI